MHTFRAKGGTIFRYNNADLSGEIHVSLDSEQARHGEARIPGTDFLEFVEHIRGNDAIEREDDFAPIAAARVTADPPPSDDGPLLFGSSPAKKPHGGW